MSHSILDAPCICPKCGWRGTVYDCEPDVDDEGSLGCFKCETIIKMIKLISDEIMEIPLSVAICPVCSGKMLAQINSWWQHQSGYWLAKTIFVGCESEPTIIDDSWDQWYIYHDLRLTMKDHNRILNIIKQWINDSYRFIQDG